MKRSLRLLKPSLAALCLIMFFAVSCSTSPGVNVGQDPLFGPFFEQVGLIMTDEEIKIWKLLPDKDSRQEFVDEFWKVRDPDPGTDENEAEEEFEERVRYANIWFGTYNPRRGQEARNEAEEKSRLGWNEDRGRVYIVLGPPDIVQFIGPDTEQVSFDGSRLRPGMEQWTMEQWIYDRYRVAVLFRKSGGGAWRIESFDSHLLEVLDWAKLNWVSGDFREDVERRFKFRAKFTGVGLRIIIPVNRVSFDENFKAEFGLKVNVYRDDKKVGTIEETKTLEKSEDELFEMKNIEFEIPYRATEKGRYLFDVVIQDRMAPALSKYRTFVKRKL
ncbi:MAG: GWxTD domain-containing protein [Candidatus Aminicenantales bacterium]